MDLWVPQCEESNTTDVQGLEVPDECFGT